MSAKKGDKSSAASRTRPRRVAQSSARPPFICLLDRPALSETFIQRELTLLRERGWPVTTLYLRGDSERLRFDLRGCPAVLRQRLLKAAWRRIVPELVHAPASALRILRRLPQAAHLAELAAASECTLIHAHFAGITADLASLAATAAGLPWSCAVHASDIFTVPAAQTRRRLRSAAGVAACSQLAADTVTAAGIQRRKVVMIRHGLPLAEYPYAPQLAGDRIFTACRLVPKKGIDLLLQACALLARRNISFTCEIAGDGPLKRELERMRDRLGVVDRVRFSGWLPQDHIRDGIKNASLIALPSRRTANGDSDGLANILVEAMALGTPVVTTAAGAAGEVVTHGQNGLLVPPEDAQALADAMAQLLASRKKRALLAQNARLSVERNLDNKRLLPDLETFLLKCATSALSRGISH